MIDIIALIIFLTSLSGIGVIVFRKIPLLTELPVSDSANRFNWRTLSGKISKVKTLNPFKGLSSGIILQKILSKIRILSLKTENKTSTWLKQIRTKAKMRKNLDANYWEEIKKSNKDE